MIYNLKNNNLLSSKDGSLKNIQDSFKKYDLINYYLEIRWENEY